ncbi:MAG: hypothetical protein AAF280_02140 [Pseudomonadota bacterium]
MLDLSLSLKRSIAEDDDAATVDCAVKTAAAVGLGEVAVDIGDRGMTTLSGNVAAAISSKSVTTGDGGG